MIEDTIEDSPRKEETSPINDGAKAKRAEQPAQLTTEEVLNKYPHLVVKLCDGEIVNANNGERIANLSQFLEANNVPEPARSDSDPRSPLSPLLLFNSDDEVPVDPSQLSDQDNTTNQRPGQDQTLAQLNHSLVDLDETAILVINETMSQDPLLSQPPSQRLSQLTLDHEEVVVATSQSLPDLQPIIAAPVNSPRVLEVNNIELQVTEDMGDLLAGFPEGWWEGKTTMTYHTNEVRWAADGVPDEEIQKTVRNRENKTPTNADCITYLYEYIEMDDPRIADHMYYRRCKPPTTIEEVYRRHTFRIRRRRYFARPAINIGGAWFPEPYLPDPEDPEWSWKEGIEMDQPAQSLYQLNEGRVYWDPYKHLRVNGLHPHYSWPGHEAVTNREIPPNPIRHVKRPLEQFARFPVKHYLGSKLTSRGRVDLVLYHPRYKGFKPKCMSELDEPLDMSWMFNPPNGEEWIKRLISEESGPKSSELQQVTMSDPIVTAKQVDLQTMRPYLSPPRSIEQTQPSHRGEYKWGSYKGNTAFSYVQEHQQRNKKKDLTTTTDTKITTSLDSHSSSGNNVKPEGAILARTPEVKPSTSRAVASTYVIPKATRKSLQSSKLNELVARVSPPARPILPRPPSAPRKSPSRSVKGTKWTRRRR